MRPNALFSRCRSHPTRSRLSTPRNLLVVLLLCCSFPASSYRTDVPPLPYGKIGTIAPSDFYVVDVTTDSAGNLYAVDQFYSTISRYSSQGTLQLRISDKTLVYPRRAAVDHVGRIYVTDPAATLSSDVIRVYAPNGSRIGTWTVPDVGEGGIQYVAPGRLYVALTEADAVAVFDTSGNELFRFGTTGSGIGQFRLPVDVAVSTNNEIYVVEMAGRVQKFDANGNFLLQWGSRGTSPGQFDSPRAISIDSSGNLFVTDRRNNRVQKFNANGVFLGEWGGKGTLPGQFLEPNGLEVAPDDSVWVAGYHAHDIQRFDNDGNLLDRWRGHVSGPGEFANLGGVAVSDGRLFVVDRFNNRIQVFDEISGDYRYQFGERGSGAATVFNFPRAITVGPDGDLYITDDNDVRRVRPDGTFVRIFPRRPGSRLPGSVGVAVSSAGILFQTDYTNNRVLKWNAETGQFLLAWGAPGSEPSQFLRPCGIAIGPDETVYVADSGNGRIQRFTQDGVFIEQWSTSLDGDSASVGPAGIVIDPGRELVFVGTFLGVRAFDLTGRFLFDWQWGGSLEEPIRLATHMAFGRDGILIAANPNGGVHRYIFHENGSLKGVPAYRPGREESVFIWKTSFDGPYHLRVNAGETERRSTYQLQLVASKPLLNLQPVLLEAGDSLSATPRSFALISTVSTFAQDGVDFVLSPHTDAILGISRTTLAGPRPVRTGARRSLLRPVGWLLPDSAFGALPVLNAGEAPALYVGRSGSALPLEVRWTAGGFSSRRLDFGLIASRPFNQVTPYLLEAHDALTRTPNAVAVKSSVWNGWDGVDATLTAGSSVGLTLSVDGLASPQSVNSPNGTFGAPNAYRIPAAEPYAAPGFRPPWQRGLYLWKDKTEGDLWFLRGTAGSVGSSQRFTGRILSNMPFVSVDAFMLEASDSLDLSDPSRIVFDFRLGGRAFDGIDFRFPPEAQVQLQLEGPADALDYLRIGAQQWPVEQMPVNLTGW